MVRPICAKCGKIFLVTDITLVVPGQIRRHNIFCKRWNPEVLKKYEYRWAFNGINHSMITIEEAEYFGYKPIAQNPNYPGNYLMVREINASM